MLCGLFSLAYRGTPHVPGGDPPKLQNVLPPSRGALLRDWPDPNDRAHLRTMFRELAKTLNDDILSPQVEIQGSLANVRGAIGSPLADRLAEDIQRAQLQLISAKGRFMNSYAKDQKYSEEAWDVLENTDALDTEWMAINLYLHTVRAAQAAAVSGQSGINLLIDPEGRLRDANFHLLNWANDCLDRLRAKQEALNH
jgi:hypothetical protein